LCPADRPRPATSMVPGEVTAMLVMLLAIGLIGACVFTVWSSLGDAPQSAANPGRSGSDTSTTDRARPESLEGALVAQLVSGQISGRQYVHAIEKLAARDDERHPLSVPPEPGPPGGSA